MCLEIVPHSKIFEPLKGPNQSLADILKMAGGEGEVREGFLCPLCMKDLGDVVQLQVDTNHLYFDLNTTISGSL